MAVECLWLEMSGQKFLCNSDEELNESIPLFSSLFIIHHLTWLFFHPCICASDTCYCQYSFPKWCCVTTSLYYYCRMAWLNNHMRVISVRHSFIALKYTHLWQFSDPLRLRACSLTMLPQPGSLSAGKQEQLEDLSKNVIALREFGPEYDARGKCRVIAEVLAATSPRVFAE